MKLMEFDVNWRLRLSGFVKLFMLATPMLLNSAIVLSSICLELGMFELTDFTNKRKRENGDN